MKQQNDRLTARKLAQQRELMYRKYKDHPDLYMRHANRIVPACARATLRERRKKQKEQDRFFGLAFFVLLVLVSLVSS